MNHGSPTLSRPVLTLTDCDLFPRGYFNMTNVFSENLSVGIHDGSKMIAFGKRAQRCFAASRPFPCGVRTVNLVFSFLNDAVALN